MTSSLLPYFFKCAYFYKISYWAFLRRVTSYRRKAPYISCCVVFKDGINFIKLYDVLCIINRNISVKLYRINIERWHTNIYDYTNIKLFVPFNIWHFSRYLLKNTFLEKRCFRIHVHHIEFIKYFQVLSFVSIDVLCLGQHTVSLPVWRSNCIEELIKTNPQK